VATEGTAEHEDLVTDSVQEPRDVN
jgi:hypothetical protein